MHLYLSGKRVLVLDVRLTREYKGKFGHWWFHLITPVENVRESMLCNPSAKYKPSRCTLDVPSLSLMTDAWLEERFPGILKRRYKKDSEAFGNFMDNHTRQIYELKELTADNL
jgi:hypothetical protein